MFRLTRYFSIISAVVVALSAVLLVGAYRWDQQAEHVQLAEEANLKLAEAFASAYWQHFLPVMSSKSRDAASPAKEGEMRALDIALRALIGSQPVLKIKIFDKRGVVIYSPIRGEVGESEAEEAEIKAALTGHSSSILAYQRSFEGFSGTVTNRHVVETYQPLISPRGGIEGVFELYSDVTTEHERLERAQAQAMVLILGCFASLYCALVLVVRRGDSLLLSQTQELKLNRAELHEQKETLHHLLDAAGEGILGLDRTGRVTFINPAALEMIGHTAVDVVGLNAHALFHHALTTEPHSSDECDILRVLAGGQDYDRRTSQFCDKDGGCFPAEYVMTSLMDGDELTGAVMVFHDVSSMVEQKQHLQRLAHFDALTSLPNRLMLADRMALAMAASRRNGQSLAVCMMDLDGFKAVNDTHGHKAGDQLLREVANRLTENIRAEDTAARLGGDEFTLLLGGFETAREYEIALGRILKAIAAPYSVVGVTVRVSASIGVTLFPKDNSDADVLLRHADKAMYEAKQSGKNCFAMFDPAGDLRRKANSSALRKIAEGLEAHHFKPSYQPVVDCRHGRVLGAEALARWQHPLLGELSSAEFLPLIENDDLIVQLDESIIRQVLEQIGAWTARGLNLDVGVNLSRRFWDRGDFLVRLKALLAGHPAETVRHLKLEIPETAAHDDFNSSANVIRGCNGLGVRVTLDSFATGCTSLSHLKRLAPDGLKIDQTIVADMLDDDGDLSMAEGVVGMAQAFGCEVVAVGVERIDQILLLLELECGVMQGNALSPPLSEAGFRAWVGQFTPDPRWQLAATQRPSRGDFQLLLAEASHRHMCERPHAFAAGDQTAKPEVTDHRICRFGEWYYGEGFNRYGGYAIFGDVEDLHARFHRVMRQLVEQIEAGEGESIRQAEADLKTLRDNFIQALRQVRGHLPHIGRF